MIYNNIGWIGLGKMGEPMALNLLKAGYAITVFNRTKDKCRHLQQAGARVANNIAELSKDCDIIISMISDDQVLGAVSLGPDGVLANLSAGGVFIDMSTVSPAFSAAVAKKAEEHEIYYLRSPVSGGVALATAGTLTIIVSGPRQIYDDCRSIFAAMGSKQFHVGEAEEARYLKLSINVMVGITSAMMAEALTFGSGGGLNWNQMLEVIGSSAIASPLVNYKLPALNRRDFTPVFSAKQMSKDFDLALDTAREDSISMPITSQVRQNLSSMTAGGMGNLDFFAYVKLLEQLAGVRPNLDPDT